LEQLGERDDLKLRISPACSFAFEGSTAIASVFIGRVGSAAVMKTTIGSRSIAE